MDFYLNHFSPCYSHDQLGKYNIYCYFGSNPRTLSATAYLVLYPYSAVTLGTGKEYLLMIEVFANDVRI